MLNLRANNGTIITVLLLLASSLLLTACTTMQTTYFRGSYQKLVDSSDPGLYPFNEMPDFAEVANMEESARKMYNRGYAMLGYSQFISPLFRSLAPSYATKYGKILGAEFVIMETPVPGESNLHAYLVTYWSKVRPEQFSFGASLQDLPDDLLKRIGQDLNLVLLPVVYPGTPAAKAGLKGDDVLLAVNDVRVESTDWFLQSLRENAGDTIDVSISRQGQQMDFEVPLATPVPMQSAVGFYETPWLNTQATDWSSLSASNIIKDAIAQQKRMEEERQQEAMRQQLVAQQNLNRLQSDRMDALERMGSSRRGGTCGPNQRRSTGCSVVPDRSQMLREYGNFNEQYKNLVNSPGFRAQMERQQKMNIWFNHAPNVYGQLFQFRRPRPM